MKRKKKFSIPAKYIFGALSFLCVLMMFLSYTMGFSGSAAGTAAGYVFVPFQKGINEIGGWFREKADSLADLKDAQDLNMELQTQIDELIAENSRLMQDKYKLQELEELYELDQTYEGYHTVVANIIGKDPGNWFSTFMIDKGKNDGIEVDMNVMVGSGLVGIVTRSEANWAQVRTIIDDMSNVSATVLSTSDSCFVQGDLQLIEEGFIQVNQLLDVDNSTQKGDKIVTSHVSDKYHEGLIIGYINELTEDSNTLTKSGTLIPAVDFEYLRTVMIITDLKQKTE